MIYLITGSNGLLGQKLLKKLIDSSCEVIATSKGINRNSESESYLYESLDITDKLQVNRVLNIYKPNVIINTAAMTNVDLCEKKRFFAISRKNRNWASGVRFSESAKSMFSPRRCRLIKGVIEKGLISKKNVKGPFLWGYQKRV